MRRAADAIAHFESTKQVLDSGVGRANDNEWFLTSLPMLPFLQQNAPLLILGSIFGGLAVIVAAMIVRHRRYGVKFPPLDPSRVLYRERWATARSHRTFVTRHSSANNCVSVAVVDDEVRVWLSFPFTILGYELDLEHRISRRAITGLKDRLHFHNRVKFLDWLIGHALLLDYTDSDGQSRRIELVLHRSLDFLKALNAQTEFDRPSLKCQ